MEKKCEIFKEFKRLLHDKKDNANTGIQLRRESNKKLYVRSWKKSKEAYLFKLSNGEI